MYDTVHRALIIDTLAYSYVYVHCVCTSMWLSTIVVYCTTLARLVSEQDDFFLVPWAEADTDVPSQKAGTGEVVANINGIF